MNLTEARAAARKNPKLRAAVATSDRKARPGAGITDDPDVDIELFALIKEATETMRDYVKALEIKGFSITYGTVAKGIVILERDEDAVSIGLIRRPDPSKGGLRPSAKAAKVGA